MSYHWIDAKDYTLNCILLFERWALRWIFTDCNAFEWFPSDGRDYKMEMAKALYRYPHVIEYVRAKAPECAAFLDELKAIPYGNWSQEEMREAENYILQAHESFVVYAYPQVMNQIDYIRKRLRMVQA